MSTNDTPGRTLRRRLAGALVVMVWLVGTATLASAQGPAAGAEPDYRNYRLARQNLVRAEQNVAALRDRLAVSEGDFDALLIEATELAGAEETLIGKLFTARQQASEYVVASYIAGRLGALDARLLAVDELLDSLYLQTVLQERAVAVADAFADYQQLLKDSGERLLSALDRIDVVYRDIQLAQRNLPLLEERREQAQWVVFVAEIHRQAEEQLVRRNRPDPTPAQWDALRNCESTGNYTVNTGNGYYGAYQFDQTTWESVGGTGRPHWAKPEVQDARARLLYATRGRAPWPNCGRYLP